MKQPQHKLQYGNRAVIFTLDMLVALTVFSIAFAVSLYYVSQTSEDKLTRAEMSSIASDILAVMDNNKTLQTLDSQMIQTQLEQLLPIAFQMRILIKTENNVTIDVGGIAPEGRFIATGKRHIVTDTDYGEVRYWIWARQ